MLETVSFLDVDIENTPAWGVVMTKFAPQPSIRNDGCAPLMRTIGVCAVAFEDAIRYSLKGVKSRAVLLFSVVTVAAIAASTAFWTPSCTGLPLT